MPTPKIARATRSRKPAILTAAALLQLEQQLQRQWYDLIHAEEAHAPDADLQTAFTLYLTTVDRLNHARAAVRPR